MRAAASLVIALAAAACGHPAPSAVPAPPTEKPGERLPVPVPVPAQQAAADPAPRTEGDVTDAWVHGIHVLVKRVPGAEATATQLYVLGGARTWTKANAGLEQLAIRTSIDGGTERMGRDAYTRRMSELGSTIDGYAASDFSVMYTWSLTPAWDETFAMLVDTFRRPALPAAQLEVARARQIAGLKHELEDPDGRLGLAMHDGMFRGHPYENRAPGTLDTVPTFTAAQIRAHLGTLRETSRMLLVVVGDVDPAHVIGAAERALGDLPRGTALAGAIPPLAAAAAGTITVIADKLPTNYIYSVAPGPGWRDPDFAVATVAMSILYQREFEEVRTKRNLSYAPSAFYTTQTDAPLVGLYVTAVDPGTTMKVMFEEARKLRDEPVPDKDLLGSKSLKLTDTFTAGEAPNDQATQLAQAQIHGGDWHLVRTLSDRVRAVTAAQISAWAGKHLTHLQTFIVGDDRKLDRALLESF